jgi:hypothetical protein
MSLKVRDKAMLFCLLSFVVSVAVASFEQKLAIILLVVSSGFFILTGLLQRMKSRSPRESASTKVVSR